MRPILISLFVSTSLISAGCAAFEAGGDVAKSTAGIFEPNPGDYGDNEGAGYSDNWSEYGRNARADRGATKLNDPVGKFWTSDKAKSIEENVGVQYQ